MLSVGSMQDRRTSILHHRLYYRQHISRILITMALGALQFSYSIPVTNLIVHSLRLAMSNINRNEADASMGTIAQLLIYSRCH